MHRQEKRMFKNSSNNAKIYKMVPRAGLEPAQLTQFHHLGLF